MSWKFNPPPGWPQQPEGWQPPPGWTPDPSWPPAQPGWQFWVPADAGSPAQGQQAQSHQAQGSQQTPAPPADSVHDAPTTISTPTPPGAAPGPDASAGAAGAPAGQPATPVQGTAPAQGSVPVQSGPPAAAGGPPGHTGAPTVPHQPGPYGAPAAPGAFPPAAAPAAQPPWHHRWWVFGVLAAVVLLVGCIAGSGAAILTSSDDDPGPVDPPAPGPSAEPTEGPDPGPGTGGELGMGDERTGQGPAIVTLDLTADVFHTITVSYTGDGFFTAYLVDDQGEHVGSALAISFGEYSGTHLVDLGRPDGATAVDIEEAEGDWSLQLQDLNDAPAWPDQTSGEGNLVMRVDQAALSGDTPLIGSHDGESNFIVWAYSDAEFGDRLMFNEIGEYEGDSLDPLPADTIALEIQADGAWTIEDDS